MLKKKLVFLLKNQGERSSHLLHLPWPSFISAGHSKLSTTSRRPDSVPESGRGHQVRLSRILVAFQLSTRVSDASVIRRTVPPESPVLGGISRCPPACIAWGSRLLCHLHSTRGQGIRNHAPVCCLGSVSPHTPYLILLAPS